MEPLFDLNSELVGWIDPGRHVFDLEMSWVAYISGGNAWSAETGDWMGPVNGLNCLDTEGRVVAWSTAQRVEGSKRPSMPMRAVRAMRPVRPMRPKRPLRPKRQLTPADGWSPLGWAGWIASGLPKMTEPGDDEVTGEAKEQEAGAKEQE